MDDRAIAELLSSGSEQAIAETNAKYGAELFRIALRLTGDPEVSEECVNDALFRAWELLRGREPAQRLLPLLGRIVRGIAIDRIRAAGSQKRSAVLIELTQELSEAIPWSGSVEHEAEANELGELIRGFVNKLPREKQTVFIRRYWYFDTIAEIASSMGTTESRVKSMLFRTRKGLRLLLERKGYDL